MGRILVWFLILLAIISVALREDFVLVVLYLFVGAYAVGHWWGRRALHSVQVQRSFNSPVFLGEPVRVRLQITNGSWLPLPWVRLRESLPVGLGTGGPFQHLGSLGPKGSLDLEYLLEGRRRGYYPLGPLNLFAGDLMGLADEQRLTIPVEYLTVFPKIIPLQHVPLLSRSPLGVLRHTQPVYEDPSRPRGKREYRSGDSLRRVDWKSSAASGKLQIKLFEPSISIEALIGLDLDPPPGDFRLRYTATELAIVIAASLSSWAASKRLPVGLLTNGVDPLAAGGIGTLIPPRRGSSHLLRILETLARLEARPASPAVTEPTPSRSFVDLLEQHMRHLAWGTALVLISPYMDESWFDRLFQAQRLGQTAYLIWCGPSGAAEAARQRAVMFGFPFQQVLDEHDLDVWRR